MNENLKSILKNTVIFGYLLNLKKVRMVRLHAPDSLKGLKLELESGVIAEKAYKIVTLDCLESWMLPQSGENNIAAFKLEKIE